MEKTNCKKSKMKIQKKIIAEEIEVVSSTKTPTKEDIKLRLIGTDVVNTKRMNVGRELWK